MTPTITGRKFTVITKLMNWWSVVRVAVGLIAAGLVLACTDSQAPSVSDTGPSPFLVSSPVPDPSPSSGMAPTSRLTAAVVYVSLPPGAIPNGTGATIRDLRTGSTVTAAMVHGGFDPVALPALVGDTLAITIQSAEGDPSSFLSVVAGGTRASVVRTDPPSHKRDVPLNGIMVIVFSEPIDPASLALGSIQLWRQTTPVPGQLASTDPAHLMATFLADAPLAGHTDYELRVTQAVRGFDGEPLAAPVSVPFTTQAAGAGSLFTVSGTVSGLAGSGLVLLNNGGDPFTVSADGSFTFATSLASGATYSVSVFAQPESPAEICIVTGGSGTLSGANVISVGIVCATSSYTVGGTVSGLTGSGLVLRNNGGDDLAVTANGSFTFATPVAKGATYSVTVFTQPASPAQTCVVAYGSGMMASVNITTVAIACATGTPQLHTVGGTVAGLAGSGLVLRDNGGDDLAVSANGTFTFAAPVADGATYNVTVFTQPANPTQMCVVTNGSGMVASANITNVAIACTTNGTLRVTVTTTGPDAPATDTLWVDLFGVRSALGSALVPSSGTFSLTLASGVHPVGLGVAQNCTVTSPNDLSVTVAAGGTTDLAFKVTCVANGTAHVTVATIGPDAPATYLVQVEDSSSGYNASAVPSNGTVSFALASGVLNVRLYLGAQNCTVTSPNIVSVTVAAGVTTDVAFSVTCVANGTAHVTVATNGPNAPATYTVHLGASTGGFDVPSNGTASFAVASGTYSMTLVVPPNCSVTGPNPVSVTVAAGAPTEIAFSVTCVATPTGTLHITVTPTGTNWPAAYEVFATRVPPGSYYGYTASTQHGTVSFAVAAGTYVVNLHLPMNCTEEPYSPGAIVVTGRTTSIDFTVACQ